MLEPKVTTDHDEIRHWVEEHDGRPAAIADAKPESTKGAVKIFFPDQHLQDPLEEISWDEFFDHFEEEDLAFMYKDDEDSRFFRLIER